MREAYLKKDGLLLFLGILGNIFGVSPNHDKHYGCFIDETNDDWPYNEGKEEHKKRCAAHSAKCA